jgi:hypothetical protein
VALREQPYLPLYVQDFLTDEKLNECSAESTGVYIRLMCIMHKSEEYGVILLKQKDKQTDKQIKNFAYKLAKQMPYSDDVIEHALVELLEEKVIHIDGDKLCQKRMIKDDEISNKRALAGKKGYNTKNNFAKAKVQAKGVEFAKAKFQANSENENEYENEFKDLNLNELISPFSSQMQTKLKEWLQYKKEWKEVYKPMGLKSLVSQIKNNLQTYQEKEIIDLISECMASPYKGIIWDKLGKEKPKNKDKPSNAYNNPQQKEFENLNRFYSN